MIKTILFIGLLFQICFAARELGNNRPNVVVASVYEERQYGMQARADTGSDSASSSPSGSGSASPSASGSGSASSSGSDSDSYGSAAQLYGNGVYDASYDIEYYSAKFTVPPIPLNTSNPTLSLEYGVLLNPAPDAVEGDAVGVWLDYNMDDENPLWTFAAAVCPHFNCSVNEQVNANPGDVISVTLIRLNGVWTATGSSSSGGVSTISAPVSSFFGPLQNAGFLWAQWKTENCNNLPTSNGVDLTDIVVKSGGVQLHNMQWYPQYVPSACSFQMAASDTVARISWNSNNWPGSSQDTCMVAQYFLRTNSWVANGKTYYQYDVALNNWGSDDITAFTFKLTPAPSQAPWNVQLNADGTYSLAPYALPFSPSYPTGTVHIGFISTEQPALTILTCEGGDHYYPSGEQPGQPKTGSTASLPDLGASGCSVSFTQTVSNSWSDGTGFASHIDVVLKNEGTRTLTALDFTPVQISAISQKPWVVAELENNHFGLPSWAPTLAPGSSISFGYIARGTTAAQFTSQATCSN